MRLSRFITTVAAISIAALSASQAYAQRANVEFNGRNATSTVQIASTLLSSNGVVTPIPFNPSFRRHPTFNGFIITSIPIDITNSRSITIDLQGATTVAYNDSDATKGLLGTSIDILDATTGTVLQREDGLSTMMQNLRVGNDTNTTHRIVIDLSTMQAKKIILQFNGVSLLRYNAPARVTIDNNASTDLK